MTTVLSSWIELHAVGPKQPPPKKTLSVHTSSDDIFSRGFLVTWDRPASSDVNTNNQSLNWQSWKQLLSSQTISHTLLVFFFLPEDVLYFLND